MARGAATDRPVGAAAVVALPSAHGLTLLRPRSRLLALQHVWRRTAAPDHHQLEAGGARGLNSLLSWIKV